MSRKAPGFIYGDKNSSIIEGAIDYDKNGAVQMVYEADNAAESPRRVVALAKALMLNALNWIAENTTTYVTSLPTEPQAFGGGMFFADIWK